MVRSMVSLVLLLAIAACGGSDSSSALEVRSSALLLNEVPKTFFAGRFVPRWHYRTNGAYDSIEFIDMAGPETTPTEVLSFPGKIVTLVSHWVVADVSYLMVGAVADSNDHFTLYRFHDSNADGRPDESTRTTVLDTGFASYVTSVARDATNGTIYLLDALCQDIWRATDSGSDGWADQLATTAFARSDDIAALLDTTWIIVADVDKVWGFDLVLPEPMILHSHAAEALILEDTDADGVVDFDLVDPPLSLNPFVSGPRPFDGQTSLTLGSVFFSQGLTAEVWLLDSDQDDVSMLGSATLTGAGAENAVAVSLSQTLATDDLIGLRFTGRAETQIVAQVWDNWPQVNLVSVNPIPAGASQIADIVGANFASSMSIEMHLPDGTSQNLPFTFVSSTKVTVTFPSISLPTGLDAARIVLMPRAQSQAVDAILPFPVEVCEASLIE